MAASSVVNGLYFTTEQFLHSLLALNFNYTFLISFNTQLNSKTCNLCITY